MRRPKDISTLDVALVRDGLKLAVERTGVRNFKVHAELLDGDYRFTSGGLVASGDKKVSHSYSASNFPDALNGVLMKYASAQELSARTFKFPRGEILTDWVLHKNGQAFFRAVPVFYVPDNVSHNDISRYTSSMQCLGFLQSAHKLFGCERTGKEKCKECLGDKIADSSRDPLPALDGILGILDAKPSLMGNPDCCYSVAARKYLETLGQGNRLVVRWSGLLQKETWIGLDALAEDYVLNGEKSAGVIGTLIRLNNHVITTYGLKSKPISKL